MRALRRYDYTPRIELTPLIDVVFLLLTFFIYSVAMMIRAQVLPVRLTPMAPGVAAAARPDPGPIDAITITRQGQIYFNRQPVTPDEFKARLVDLAHTPAAQRARLFLAVEAQGDRDRAPLLFDLIQQITTAGITDLTMVGQPTAPVPGRPPTPPAEATPPRSPAP